MRLPTAIVLSVTLVCVTVLALNNPAMVKDIGFMLLVLAFFAFMAIKL